EGNLTRDPEVVQLAEGTTMTRFSIGVNRYYMNRFKEYVSEASFFVIITWGNIAESCNKYLRKGRGVRVLGRLRQERWMTKDNEPKDRVVVVAEHVEFQPERKDKEGSFEDSRPEIQIDIDPSIEIPSPDEMGIDMDSLDRVESTGGKKVKTSN
ncbi:MAG: single-stranded DNA-binding protein, partial [Spirochaetales bacterium]|nr:single-stranded DNA-binding protein [Spirochaetales bacterium]